MKTAISIDDDLFKIAEKTAKKIGVSRSQLFSKAIKEFIEHHNPQKITQRLNDVFSSNKNSDEFDTAQINSIEFGEW